MTNVETIFAWYINIAGTTLPSLKYLKKITLILINDKILPYLKNIDDISIDQSSITDEGMKYLKNMSYIKLCQCNNLTNQGIINVLKPYPEKQSIVIDSCDNVTYQINNEVMKINPNIEINKITRPKSCTLI